MRSSFTLALSAAVANAQFSFIGASTNECWFNEGAQWLGKCKSLFYWKCDEYEINAGDSCNVATFSDTQIQWEWEEVTVSTMAHGYESGWKKAQKNSDSESTSFDSFLRQVSTFTTQAVQKLIYISDNIPEDSHEYYSSWEDPFSEGCFELQTSPIIYDQETRPKLNKMSGMCGFRITFENDNQFSGLPVQVHYDGATSLVSSAIAIAAVSAALF